MDAVPPSTPAGHLSVGQYDLVKKAPKAYRLVVNKWFNQAIHHCFDAYDNHPEPPKTDKQYFKALVSSLVNQTMQHRGTFYEASGATIITPGPVGSFTLSINNPGSIVSQTQDRNEIRKKLSKMASDIKYNNLTRGAGEYQSSQDSSTHSSHSLSHACIPSGAIIETPRPANGPKMDELFQLAAVPPTGRTAAPTAPPPVDQDAATDPADDGAQAPTATTPLEQPPPAASAEVHAPTATSPTVRTEATDPSLQAQGESDGQQQQADSPPPPSVPTPREQPTLGGDHQAPPMASPSQQQMDDYRDAVLSYLSTMAK